MSTINIIIYILFVLLTFEIISIYFVKKKASKITAKSEARFVFKQKYINTYKDKIEFKLTTLGNPYGLTFAKYCLIKYGLSIIIFVISIINYSNFFIPVILFLVIFFIPNYLIYSFQKTESVMIIKELKNISENILLYLTSYVPLKNAIKEVTKSIDNKRLKEAFEQFAYDYESHGFNISYASKFLKSKFKSNELELFLSTLIQSEKEGNLVENLQKYMEIIELSYFKYIKQQANKRLGYVVFGILISLVSMVLVVMYPIFVQVFASLQNIFN